VSSILRRIEHEVHRITNRFVSNIERDFNPKTGRLFSALIPGLVPGESVRENEHLFKRQAYYVNKVFPYIAGAAVFVISIIGTPILGSALAVALGEVARWQGYYVDRDVSGLSAWQARRAARAEANQTWEYGGFGAAAGALVSLAAGAIASLTATAETGAEAGAEGSVHVASGLLVDGSVPAAPSFLESVGSTVGDVGDAIKGAASSVYDFATSPTAWQNVLGNAWNSLMDQIGIVSPDVTGYDTGYLAEVAKESASLSALPGVETSASLAASFPATPGPGFLQNLVSFKWLGDTLSYVWTNPLQSLGLITGLGSVTATLGGQLGWFGKSGQAIAADLTLGQDLLAGGGGLGGGGGPGFGGGGGGPDPSADTPDSGGGVMGYIPWILGAVLLAALIAFLV